jgi:hypothetical protein
MSNLEYPFNSFDNLDKVSDQKPKIPTYKPFTPPQPQPQAQVTPQTSNEDFGFSFLHENEINEQITQAATSAANQTEMTYKQKLEEVEKIIVPFLTNLQKDPEKIMIKWPNRKQVVESQLKKILSITRS